MNVSSPPVAGGPSVLPPAMSDWPASTSDEPPVPGEPPVLEPPEPSPPLPPVLPSLPPVLLPPEPPLASLPPEPPFELPPEPPFELPPEPPSSPLSEPPVPSSAGGVLAQPQAATASPTPRTIPIDDRKDFFMSALQGVYAGAP